MNIQARTAGELAELCAANPKDPLGDAKINFCHGFAQGAIHGRAPSLRGQEGVLFPKPSADRTATMSEFVSWVRALPEHRIAARRSMGSSSSWANGSPANRPTFALLDTHPDGS